MNVKLWAGVIVAMLVLTGTGLYLESQANLNKRPSDDSAMTIVARVNTEGSGIFANEADMVPRDPNTGELLPFGDQLETYQNKWDGKLFIIPGTSSIQFIMLKIFVEEELKMNFQVSGTPASGKVVYWMIVGAGQMLDRINSDSSIDGGIVWEPNYQDIIQNTSMRAVLLTGELQDGHACCIIAANREYASTNIAELVRFLAVYVKTVTWMNNAISVGSGNADYEELVGIAMNYIYPGVDPADPEKRRVIEESFKTVVYEYNIGTLAKEVEDLVDKFYELGLLANSLDSIGFRNSKEFSEWLVTDNYLELATSDDLVLGDSPMTIRVAILAMDIHQLAIEVGEQKGYFSEYNINIEKTIVYATGGAVANLIITRSVDIGFLGTPPAVSTAINSGR